MLGAVSLARALLEAIMHVHWLLGLFCAALILLVLGWMISWIKHAAYTPHNFGYYPKIGLALHLFLVIFMAQLAMAFVSYILFQNGLVCFYSKEPITVSRLLDYYGWHFIDSLPFLAVWDTFDFSSRIKANDFGGRILLELFRVLIVATVIQTFMTKQGDFRRQLKTAQAYRNEENYDKAYITMISALKRAEHSRDSLQLVDANIELAKILLNKNSKEKSKKHLETAAMFLELAVKERDLESRKSEIVELDKRFL